MLLFNMMNVVTSDVANIEVYENYIKRINLIAEVYSHTKEYSDIYLRLSDSVKRTIVILIYF